MLEVEAGINMDSIGDMPDAARVLVVDNHAVTHLGLRLLFAADLRYQVIGCLQRGMLVGAFLASEAVDLIILDLQLPDTRGVNVVAELIGAHDMTVVILTGAASFAEVDYAMRLGVRAVVSKADATREILAACDAALSGDTYISSAMKTSLAGFSPPAITLSARQMAILHFLAEGASNKEISGRLAIAAPTVSFHLSELMRRLEVRSDSAIIPRAREWNLL